MRSGICFVTSYGKWKNDKWNILNGIKILSITLINFLQTPTIKKLSSFFPRDFLCFLTRSRNKHETKKPYCEKLRNPVSSQWELALLGVVDAPTMPLFPVSPTRSTTALVRSSAALPPLFYINSVSPATAKSHNFKIDDGRLIRKFQ